MSIRNITAKQAVKFLLVGLLFLFLISKFVNFAAIGTDATVFMAPPDNLVVQMFTMLIVVMATWVAWNLTIGFEGRMDTKRIVTLALLGAGLFLIYQYVLVPSGLVDLTSLEFTAAKLQALILP